MCELSNQVKSQLSALFLGLFVVFGSVASAQISIIDFDSPLHAFNGFNGCVTTVAVDPNNGNNNVGKFVNNGDVWEGAGLKLPVDIFLDSAKLVEMKFYQPAQGPTLVLMKLVDQVRTPVEVVHTVTDSGWTALTFDFSQAFVSGVGTPVNADGGFSRLEIFIDGGTTKTGTFYIDDIEYPNYESANSLDVIYTNQVFADEFLAFGPIDTAVWFPQVEPEFPGVGWPNNEEQHYTNRTDNVYTSNGSLKITAKKETFTAYGLTKNYTSARLNSKFDFTYGRVDVRAKLPQGDGTWPAIWMLGTSFGNNWNAQTMAWPTCGEIDIMEHWGNEPNYTHSSLHNLSSSGATINTQRVINEDVFSEWHVYSMNWSPNQISFLIDGFLFYTYNPQIKDATTWPYDNPHFILLNVAMGGIYPIDPNFTQATMEIDYVRVFQNNISIGENTFETEVNVYPNPARDIIAINAKESGEFSLYDLLGKELLHQVIDRSGEIKIKLPALAAGTYVWQYQAGGDSASGKLQIINQ